MDVKPPAPASPFPPASDRLDSWKEIARHLKRDVRTAQRWEASDRLPVYRHQHGKHGSVYAYKSEIDSWWAARRPQIQRQDHFHGQRERGSSGPRAFPSNLRLIIYAVIFIILALLILGAAHRLLSRHSESRPATAEITLSFTVLPYMTLTRDSGDSRSRTLNAKIDGTSAT